MEVKKGREPTPFERMTDFTRRIIHVQKDEVPEHKPQRRRKRKSRSQG
jgi:hypothetical protein